MASVLLCFQALTRGNISRLSLSTQPLGRRPVAAPERVSVLARAPTQLALGLFLQMPKAEVDTCGWDTTQELEETLRTKNREFKAQGSSSQFVCCTGCHLGEDHVGSKRRQYIPRCPLWAHHTPFLQRARARHKEGCHTTSSAAARE